MTSSPPATDTQINPSGTTLHTNISSLVPLITPSVPITPINPLALTQHERTSSQNLFDINLPLAITLHGTIPGTNFPYNTPTHYTKLPLNGSCEVAIRFGSIIQNINKL